MLVIPENLKPKSSEYDSTIQIVYSRVDKFLQYPLHLHYTDHSLAHSERIIDIASMLLRETKIVLHDVEKYILVNSILLHDIGMQTPHFYSEKSELSADDLEKIREKHHEFTERMIIESVTKSNDDKYYFGLDSNRELVDLIARVAKAHRKIDLSLLEDVFIAGTTIRIKLLATILRLSDCLDMDFRRVNVERLSSLNIPVLSKLFWFRHQYVEGVKIEHQKIGIYFCFPKEYESEKDFIDVIINYTMKELNNQIDEVYDILDFYGLRLHKDVPFYKRFTAVQRYMPKDLIAYIKTLGKNNVVINDKVFDVYPTRDLCLDDILLNIAEVGPNYMVVFGGISSRLCRERDIEVFSKWLKKNNNAELYLCYEIDEAAMARASSLNVDSLPKDGQPLEPHIRLLKKINEVIGSIELYPNDIKNRINFIPIAKALNTYPIMVGEDFYCNILTAVRSSESTTAKMRNNSVGNKTKIELMSYMLFILGNSPQIPANMNLVKIIENQKKLI